MHPSARKNCWNCWGKTKKQCSGPAAGRTEPGVRPKSSQGAEDTETETYRHGPILDWPRRLKLPLTLVLAWLIIDLLIGRKFATKTNEKAESWYDSAFS